MAARKRYDAELRAIGQALEARDISVFELTRTADHYIVRGEPDQTGSRASRLRHWLRRRILGAAGEAIRFRSTDVERLDEIGRAKRTEGGRLPNFQDVSSFLRTIGSYLDRKQVELLGIEKRRISITLSYQDRGQKQQEDRTISSFHPIFVELCAMRGKSEQTAWSSKTAN